MSARRRVLILGSEGHWRGLRAHSWQRLPPDLNVADFDAVILNFAEFEDEDVRRNVRLHNVPSAEQFSRLIFSEGAIVVAVGSPLVVFGNTNRPATYWLPVELPAKAEAGETIRVLDAEWEFWFEKIRRFKWHFWNKPEVTSAGYKLTTAQSAVPWALAVTGSWAPLAETRYGDPIGIRLEVYAMRTSAARTPGSPNKVRREKAGGRIYWLPAPDAITQREAVDLLLTRIFGVHMETPRPDWVDRFLLPRQVDAIAGVLKQRQAVEDALGVLRDAEERAERAARFERLLFEQGKEGLEPVVREALQELGANVVEPEREGIEDGRLVDPQGRGAMLEIKGRRGQLKLEDVRQLDGWMRSAMAEEGWDGKGIIVANLKLEQPPDERDDVVASNAAAFAARVKVAILTTSQLHAAFRLAQAGELDHAHFWDMVFLADGLVDLPDAASDGS